MFLHTGVKTDSGELFDVMDDMSSTGWVAILLN